MKTDYIILQPCGNSYKPLAFADGEMVFYHSLEEARDDCRPDKGELVAKIETLE